MKAEIERPAVRLCCLRGQTGGLGHGSEAGGGLDSVLLDDAIGGVEGRPGDIDDQVDEDAPALRHWCAESPLAIRISMFDSPLLQKEDLSPWLRSSFWSR